MAWGRAHQYPVQKPPSRGPAHKESHGSASASVGADNFKAAAGITHPGGGARRRARALVPLQSAWLAFCTRTDVRRTGLKVHCARHVANETGKPKSPAQKVLQVVCANGVHSEDSALHHLQQVSRNARVHILRFTFLRSHCSASRKTL
jgi:hypothetical protein